MGLGGFIYAGGIATLMLLGEALGRKGMPLRTVTDKRGYSYPVGIDGLMETHMPPYMTVDEAVDDVWNMKFKSGYGRYNAEVKEGDKVLYKGFDPNPRAVYRPYRDGEGYCKASPVQPPEAVQIGKDVMNYIYDTYGRFPRYFDPITCHLMVQISHIDVDFYDHYQVDGSIWEEQRKHLSTWHK